jgi:hypothetical protein
MQETAGIYGNLLYRSPICRTSPRVVCGQEKEMLCEGNKIMQPHVQGGAVHLEYKARDKILGGLNVVERLSVQTCLIMKAAVFTYTSLTR